MSNLQKMNSNSNGVELMDVVISPSDEKERMICWEAEFSSQFPVSLSNQRDGKTILNVNTPHEGYTIETQIKESKMQGKSYLYSGENILVAELNFEGGIADGPCKLYDTAGNLFFEGFFQNGYRSGGGKEYDREGNVVYDGYFKNGKRLLNLVRLNEMEGYWKEYDKNGLLLSISERNIVTGEKEGICYYYKNGEISRVVNCSEGKESEYSGYLKLYDEPHKLWFEGQYYNGIFHGDVQQDASSGDTAFEGFYDNGKILRTEKMKEKRGYRKEYDEQDHLVHICKRDKNGRFVGICYRYDAKGRISRISEWKGGKEKALIKMFNGGKMTEYKSGIKRYEGEFCDSFFFDYCRNGQGKEFDKDGKTVIYSGCYLVGKRHGNGISYKNRKKDYDGEWIQGKRKTNYYVCLSLRIVITIIIIIGLTIGVFYLNMVVGIIVVVFLLLWVILYIFWTYGTVNSRFSLQLAKVLHKPNFKIGNDHFNQISELSFPSLVESIEIGDNGIN